MLYQKGIALAHMENHEEAISAFEAAITISPLIADAHYQMGLSLAASGQHNEAVNAFTRVL